MVDLNHSQNLAGCQRNRCLHIPLLLPVLVDVLALLLVGKVTAQTFTTLHSFDTDGSPNGLILSGKTLYGTTTGTVFAVSTDGSGFTNLHSFTDGASLSAGLILSGNTLYATTSGGSSSNGIVFSINTDGTGFTNLHSFSASSTNSLGIYTNSDGVGPAGLVLSNNTLYGSASGGGVSGSGTVFVLNTDGTGFTNLHQFTSLTAAFDGTGPPQFTNGDGANPGGLILSGNALYVTTYVGGYGNGTVLAVNTDGTGPTNLYNFPRAFLTSPISHSDVILLSNTLFGAEQHKNSDAAGPIFGTVFALNTDGSGSRTLYTNYLAGLISLGGKLYGAVNGPTVVSINTDGTGFANLHTFTFNSLDSSPRVLILSGNALDGLLQRGDNGFNGDVFAVNTGGTAFTVLHSFTAFPPLPSPQTNNDGAFPNNLILSGNTFYGTTTGGGIAGSGTLFSISLPPPLTMTPAGSNLKLSWPTNFTGFYLQDTVTVGSPKDWITTTLPFPPVILNGQFVVTIPMPPTTHHFYRLSQ